jgi:hypothetical protein
LSANLPASVTAAGGRGGEKKFTVGDSLELMTPQGNVNFTLEHMENGKGEAMPVARAMAIPYGCLFRKNGAAVCAADA